MEHMVALLWDRCKKVAAKRSLLPEAPPSFLTLSSNIILNLVKLSTGQEYGFKRILFNATTNQYRFSSLGDQTLWHSSGLGQNKS